MKISSLWVALTSVVALAQCMRPAPDTVGTGSSGDQHATDTVAMDSGTSPEDSAVAAPTLPEGAECARDEDCVRATCCHATACVPVARRPACEGMMCTMECRPGTLDCGGSCVCQQGRCGATGGGPQIDVSALTGADAGASIADASGDVAVRRPARRR
ncbi:MAG: hypothetical protein Q8Q09_10460 [Deltaproteobacteria bacterium]|nr:hypothetical protein [Deltaproteobacteria bacterium]